MLDIEHPQDGIGEELADFARLTPPEILLLGDAGDLPIARVQDQAARSPGQLHLERSGVFELARFLRRRRVIGGGAHAGHELAHPGQGLAVGRGDQQDDVARQRVAVRRQPPGALEHDGQIAGLAGARRQVRNVAVRVQIPGEHQGFRSRLTRREAGYEIARKARLQVHPRPDRHPLAFEQFRVAVKEEAGEIDRGRDRVRPERRRGGLIGGRIVDHGAGAHPGHGIPGLADGQEDNGALHVHILELARQAQLGGAHRARDPGRRGRDRAEIVGQQRMDADAGDLHARLVGESALAGDRHGDLERLLDDRVAELLQFALHVVGRRGGPGGTCETTAAGGDRLKVGAQPGLAGLTEHARIVRSALALGRQLPLHRCREPVEAEKRGHRHHAQYGHQGQVCHD